MSGYFRPHGHLGADSTKLSAERKILMDHFGRFYHFVQRLGGMPGAYFIIGAVIGRSYGWAMVFVYGLVAAIYSFFFHIVAISVFAAKAKIGCQQCPKKSSGYYWSKAFVTRGLIYHMYMLSSLIWLGSVWFLASGFIIYIFDTVITFVTCSKYLVVQKGKKGKDKKDRKNK
ncbi:MAG: hypothetical protein NTY09_04045 [bacterium]|nr:hypothetical protein [bacterium]